MSMMVNSHRFGGVVTASNNYVVVQTPGTQTVAVNDVLDLSSVIAGSSAQFDSANDALNAAAGGTLIRLSGAKDAGPGFLSVVNAVGHSGRLFLGAGNASRRSGVSSFISCVDTDDFKAIAFNSGGSINTNTWLAIETVDPASKYCLVTKTGNQNISAGGTWFPITWDNEVVDTHGFHDNSSNTNRLSVPSGITNVAFARVTAGIRVTASSTDWVWTHIFRDNTERADGCARLAYEGATDERSAVCTAIVPVTPGTTYFDVQQRHESGGGGKNVIGGSTESWAQIETFPSTYKFASIRTSASQAVSAGVTVTKTFGSAISDANGYRSGSTIVAPSGVTQARVSYCIETANATGNVLSWARQNASAFLQPGMPTSGSACDVEDAVNGMGSWVPCSPGDVFDIQINCATAQTLPDSGLSWMCVEFR